MESVALFGAYVSLIKVLHKKKLIHIDDVIAEIGNSIDFAGMEHMEQPSKKYSLTIYNELIAISAALARADNK